MKNIPDFPAFWKLIDILKIDRALVLVINMFNEVLNIFILIVEFSQFVVLIENLV